MYVKEKSDTHPAWICGYVLTPHAGCVSRRRGCCVAGWLGVKATQSYWRQVWVRRWLTKPNHMGECCLGHLTIRPFTACVRACVSLYIRSPIHIFAFGLAVRAAWTLDEGSWVWGLIALHGAQWEVPRLDGGTSDWSWSWMREGWGVECLIQILTGTDSHSRRRYSIHWTPSIP